MNAGVSMKLSYKKGCLIAALKNREVEAIAHQANCFCTMKSGIAPLIADEWPDVRKVDNLTARGDVDKMGHFTFAKVPEGKIFNIYGQYHWSRKHPRYGTSYEHLGLGFSRVCDFMVNNKIQTLGLPRIGCGLAGGDWGVVEHLIKMHFAHTDIEVIVYELEK